MYDIGTNPKTSDESTDSTTTRWQSADSKLDEPLPTDLQSALGRFVGTESVDTLGEWADEVRRQTGGGSLSLEALCHSSETTGHWGEMNGERYHFDCFYDAVIMAAIADEPVDIHTESPDGDVIEARSDGGTDLLVMPADAVFSFGISTDVTARDDGLTPEDSYEAICPYVKAFPNREAYEEWAANVEAPTVGMPLAGATELATALAA